jgi:short-subunit dehydrogenase
MRHRSIELQYHFTHNQLFLRYYQTYAHPCLVARRADRLNELALELRTRCGIEVQAIAADLSTPEGQAELESETEHLDVGLLVASAGYGTSVPLLQVNLRQERNILHLNCSRSSNSA